MTPEAQRVKCWGIQITRTDGTKCLASGCECSPYALYSAYKGAAAFSKELKSHITGTPKVVRVIVTAEVIEK